MQIYFKVGVKYYWFQFERNDNKKPTIITI